MLQHRGIEFCFIFDKDIDYFDIVPDLEKLTKRRMSLKKNRELTVIPMKETDQRLVKSEYYKVHEDEWFNSRYHHYKIGDDVIPLTPEEKNIIGMIDIYLMSTDISVASRGWFDVAYFA